jgi:hypothetical protein
MKIEQTSSAQGLAVLIPRQRAPFGETMRRILLPIPVPPSMGESELDAWCADLCEVSVWTSSRGSWQENAFFVLATADGARHLVAFCEPVAGALIARLRALPDFDDDRLLDLIGCRTEKITVLWRRPVPMPERV